MLQKMWFIDMTPVFTSHVARVDADSAGARIQDSLRIEIYSINVYY
jgi:hypothetical protein